jgi:hypothetical protein
MQGKEVDMDKLVRQHELMPAIGNIRVNARGDELGAAGQVVRKREEIIAEYYENNPKAKSERSAADPAVTKTEETVTTKRAK